MNVSTSKISIVLPVHNQQEHIGELLPRLHAAVNDLAPCVEMIAVVNASSDRSAQRCREVAAKCPGLVVLEREQPGWGGAVRAGLAAATGDLLCFTNSARTSPQDLRTAIALGVLNEGYATKAVRRSRDSIARRTGSVLYNFEARALFGLASWDLNGTPKVFPRTFHRLLELNEDGDLLDLEWLVTCERAGYPLIEFPALSVKRHGGKSTTKLGSAKRMYLGAVALRRRLGGASDTVATGTHV
jgi:glycosyltransferase involved in cell wall biosynthesis